MDNYTEQPTEHTVGTAIQLRSYNINHTDSVMQYRDSVVAWHVTLWSVVCGVVHAMLCVTLGT
jgi:hypothetical protein